MSPKQQIVDRKVQSIYIKHRNTAKTFAINLDEAKYLYDSSFADIYAQQPAEKIIDIAQRNAFHKYLMTSMQRAWQAEQKRKAKTGELNDDDQACTPATSSPPSFERRAQFYQALQALPLSTRKVVCAHAIYQHDREIAEHCDLTIDQVRERRYTAKKIFKEHGLGIAGILPAPFLIEVWGSPPALKKISYAFKLALAKMMPASQTTFERIIEQSTTTQAPIEAAATGAAAITVTGKLLAVTTGTLIVGGGVAATVKHPSNHLKTIHNQAIAATQHTLSSLPKQPTSHVTTVTENKPHKKPHKKHRKHNKHRRKPKQPSHHTVVAAPHVQRPPTPAPAKTPPPSAAPRSPSPPASPSGPGAGDVGDWE